MKRILITQRVVACGDYSEVRDALDVRWAQFFRSVGMLPLSLPSTADPEVYLSECAVDGVVLSGGNDLAHLAENADEAKLSLQRDNLETALLRLAIDRQLPVLGVCRGLQMIAHYFQLPLVPVLGHSGTRHGITVAPESRWARELCQVGMVNSYHNWGPVAGGLTGAESEALRIAGTATAAAAAADAGGETVIEALEHRELPILGIMWHPERDEPFEAANIALFRRFFGG